MFKTRSRIKGLTNVPKSMIALIVVFSVSTLLLVGFLVTSFVLKPTKAIGVVEHVRDIDGEYTLDTAPTGFATDSEGNIYQTAVNNYSVRKFSPSGVFIKEWGKANNPDNPNHFIDYTGGPIAVDSQDNVYVADYMRGRINKFDSDLNLIFQWGSRSLNCSIGGGVFCGYSGLTDIKIDSQDNVYVAESKTSDGLGAINRIHKFSPNGTFIAQWGQNGTGNGEFGTAVSEYGAYVKLAVDSQDNVYATDVINHRIQKFNSSGSYLSQWGSEGSGDNQFNRLDSIDVDSQDNVYVRDGQRVSSSETAEFRIKKFTSSGSYISQWGSVGVAEDQFQDLRYIFDAYYLIHIDDQDRVYTTGNVHNDVQVFTTSGVLTQKLTSIMDKPVSIAVDDQGYKYLLNRYYVQKIDHNDNVVLSFGVPRTHGSGVNNALADGVDIEVDSQGYIYVADVYSTMVKKFNTAGVEVAEWYMSNDPYGLAIDSQDNVYVFDNTPIVRKFNSSGTQLVQLGGYGTGNGKFNGITDLAVDSLDNLYVIDSPNNRVQKFNSSGTYLSQWSIPSAEGPAYNRSIAIDYIGNVFVSYTGIYGEYSGLDVFTSEGDYLGRHTVQDTPDVSSGDSSALKKIAVDNRKNIYLVYDMGYGGGFFGRGRVGILHNSELSIDTLSLPGGTVGSNYSQTIVTSGASGEVDFSLQSGSLPPGLSLVSSGETTASVTGTPTQAGSFTFTVHAEDVVDETNRQFTIVINPAPAEDELNILTEALPDGTVGEDYTFALEAENAEGPLVWSLTGGSLDVGLGLSSAGLISGVPVLEGVYNVTVSVSDGQSSASKQFNHLVHPGDEDGGETPITPNTPGSVIPTPPKTGTVLTAVIIATTAVATLSMLMLIESLHRHRKASSEK